MKVGDRVSHHGLGLGEVMTQDLQTILGDRPIAYHPILAKIFSSATAGVYLSQLLYWSPRGSSGDGWFYKTQKEMEEETGLTRSEQDTARRKLVLAGIIEVVRRRVPATLHFRIQWEALQTSLQDFSKLDRRIPANQIVGKQQTISESTTETTSDPPSVNPLSIWLANDTVGDPNAFTSKSDLLAAYNWAVTNRGQAGLTATAFGLALKRLRPEIREAQRTVAGRKKVWCYLGLGLRGPSEWPDWYATLYSIPAFKVTLEHAQTWLTSRGISEDHAENTAYALKGRWDGKKYKDPWATFQNWAKRPPLNGGSNGTRGQLPANDSREAQDPDAFTRRGNVPPVRPRSA